MGKSTFLQDFKAFAMKGNVIDMAVGVVIGGAFGKIVSSLVANVIMPPIGLLVGGVNFTDLKWVMKAAEVGADGKEIAPAVSLDYGQFHTGYVRLSDYCFFYIFIYTFDNEVDNKEKRGSCSYAACSSGTYQGGSAVDGDPRLAEREKVMDPRPDDSDSKI